jgi:hypothetical protein
MCSVLVFVTDTRKAVRRSPLHQTGLHVTSCYACFAKQLL